MTVLLTVKGSEFEANFEYGHTQIFQIEIRRESLDPMRWLKSFEGPEK